MENLNLIISELSIYIFENDNIPHIKLYSKCEEYINNKWNLIPDNIDYVIDKAFDVYYLM